jgi:hypothetical protein
VPDLATAFAAPLSGDPDGSTTRGTTVLAGNPDVGAAVPAMVAGNPGVSGAGCGDNLDAAGWGWTDADDKLCAGDCGSQREKCSRRSDEKSLVEVHCSSLMLPVVETRFLRKKLRLRADFGSSLCSINWLVQMEKVL